MMERYIEIIITVVIILMALGAGYIWAYNTEKGVRKVECDLNPMAQYTIGGEDYVFLPAASWLDYYKNNWCKWSEIIIHAEIPCDVTLHGIEVVPYVDSGQTIGFPPLVIERDIDGFRIKAESQEGE